MATKQIPNRCIWCLREPSSATFESESHVLPKCVGNKRQQILPLGIVCDQCNHYFGIKVEPTLIDDPIFKTIVGILQLRDKKGEFVYEHSPSGVHRDVHIEAEVSHTGVTVSTRYQIRGQPSNQYEDRSIQPQSKVYDKRSLALLSRAVHKIAFESLAHSLFIGAGLKFEKSDFRNIDIFDRKFDVVRNWVRYGKPHSPVREVLRIQKFDEVNSQEELFQWEIFLFGFRQWLRCELNLFRDWYIMSLTSPLDKVENDLRGWVELTKSSYPVWMIGDKLKQVR